MLGISDQPANGPMVHGWARPPAQIYVGNDSVDPILVLKPVGGKITTADLVVCRRRSTNVCIDTSGM